mmetsp:Transcript_78167/g.211439  ORF Transcript_78167/g.211439 Transcript_78167/m.211439 type:complete len:223 (-) Transcript_78167:650-1318(-)
MRRAPAGRSRCPPASAPLWARGRAAAAGACARASRTGASRPPPAPRTARAPAPRCSPATSARRRCSRPPCARRPRCGAAAGASDGPSSWPRRRMPGACRSLPAARRRRRPGSSSSSARWWRCLTAARCPRPLAPRRCTRGSRRARPTRSAPRRGTRTWPAGLKQADGPRRHRRPPAASGASCRAPPPLATSGCAPCSGASCRPCRQQRRPWASLSASPTRGP